MSTLKLYYFKHSRASRVRWALEELGVDHEIVPLVDGRFGEVDYSEIHPLNLIPALTDGETKIFETTAICMYLADKFQKLAPALDEQSARGSYYQWMVFAATELDKTVEDIFMQVRRLPLEFRNEGAEHLARNRFTDRAVMLNDYLSTREFMLGTEFTMVDVLVASVLGWAESLRLLHDYPTLRAYRARMESRPAAVRSRAEPVRPESDTIV